MHSPSDSRRLMFSNRLQRHEVKNPSRLRARCQPFPQQPPKGLTNGKPQRLASQEYGIDQKLKPAGNRKLKRPP
ncbi:hypothetical protein BDP55DRAFT_653027 [Colletotrichum godetiae]|uniref:Uncharacterized protein n=1 Tax=Colletotrichum godetiae TaxID=1209918 RepID=A0AAJ0F1D0_9PEZI|nr:uncharacterized protein BDP55DRAFT_653027 [Colletotrichum godetiae]KAK1689382.1 hypothetical protein BDP55DRAFT_653027 [Colletotrichum godetiae]